ncbi:MAG: hypothetical protein A3F11_00370 [Gammaproteobacteria bacterium RIFCSPHIGHO2_12_FULL_37_14]|nr:MAG: hypothetical protein A3F11_00370 [Gammaproteobacteria bacterium RIFCSPHIGHO2_12_FULL_37_14]
MNFFKDPEVKALIATGGGYGSQRLLPLLDYDFIRAHPKIVMGFSDTTALQLGLLKKAGLISYTGFTLADTQNASSESLLEETLTLSLLGKPYEIKEGTPMCLGTVQGPLIGGNLDLIRALIGTSYQPNFEGSILLIEEVRQEPYKIDCGLSQRNRLGKHIFLI